MAGSRPVFFYRRHAGSGHQAARHLGVIQRVEARGAIDSAHRIKQVCGQILRYGVAIGWVERDVTPDLRAALVAVPRKNFAAITEPKDLAPLLRAMYAYEGHAVVVAALKLTPMLVCPSGRIARRGVAKNLHPAAGHGKYVFPSLRTDDACMSDNTINAALRYRGFAKEVMTAHGLRATARTILDQVQGERVDLIEHQLAHRVIDPNGRAYNRTAHLRTRAAMMQRWSHYLDQLRAGAEIHSDSSCVHLWSELVVDSFAGKRWSRHYDVSTTWRSECTRGACMTT